MKTKKYQYRRKALAASISSLMLGSFHVSAQNSAVEEVVVTGIRASLQRSMDQKRDASGVLDAITAEDIGKFPDTNLAESMQRIPGVSINREGGEGSRVTVRGLGPNFNLVTHNGRTIAKTTNDRSFNFADLASELVAGVTVAKSADATTDSGGMGATINITSIRPLALDGQKIILSGKAISDRSWGGGNTPQIFGLYANTFANDTVGISIALDYQERESSRARAQIDNGWKTFRGDNGQNDTQPEFGLYSKPQSARYKFESDTRERVNGQLVLQWAPTENIEATLDFDTYERSVYSARSEVSSWFAYAQNDPEKGKYPINAVWHTDNNISTPIIYSETYRDLTDPEDDESEDVAMPAGHFAHDYSGSTLGVNLSWQLTESLSLELDASHSEARDEPGHALGSDITLSVSTNERTSSTVDTTSEVFSVINGGPTAVPSDVTVTGSWFQNHESETEVDQFHLSGRFEFNDENSIDFGVRSTEFSSVRQNTNVQQNNWGGLEAPAGTEGQLAAVFENTQQYARERFNGALADFSSVRDLTDANVDGDNNPATLADGTNLQSARPMSHFFEWDIEALQAYAQASFPGVQSDEGYQGLCPDGTASAFCASQDYDKGTNNSTTETTGAVYLQYSFERDAFRGRIGLRYETTDVESSGVSRFYRGTNWVSDTEIVFVDPDDQFVSGSGSYSNTLPNIDLSYDVTDDVVLRWSWNKAIARPGYGDLGSNIAVGSGIQRQLGRANGNEGNPDLLPFESRNMDVSIEWYYGDASYFSATGFTKTVSNFIAQETTTFRGRYSDRMPIVTNPYSSSLVEEAFNTIGISADGNDVRAYIFDNYNGQPGIIDETPDIAGDAEGTITGQPEHEQVLFDMSKPSNNGDDRTLNGLELSLQHIFGDTGFGVSTNYTNVNTDLEWDVTRFTRDQRPLIGVSDSANLIGFYEKNGWNIRVAYNWRDKFLNQYNQDTHPLFINAYSQWDIGISYEITDNLKVSLDGINVTEEAYVTSARNSRQIYQWDEYGSRYMLGASYSF